ncbi:hypothetical protein L5515_018558 [Caenorhabditis briggsae]|uniref:Uncharacterized protein n=1 Tax=Caenorhabditis briggsae TaxID=6238 RepID=A0AAE9JSF4_CAEBR|nr:hypothetical protein L5515_018558 [Caenorhabditis briggsae]
MYMMQFSRKICRSYVSHREIDFRRAISGSTGIAFCNGEVNFNIVRREVTCSFKTVQASTTSEFNLRIDERRLKSFLELMQVSNSSFRFREALLHLPMEESKHLFSIREAGDMDRFGLFFSQRLFLCIRTIPGLHCTLLKAQYVFSAQGLFLNPIIQKTMATHGSQHCFETQEQRKTVESLFCVFICYHEHF